MCGSTSRATPRSRWGSPRPAPGDGARPATHWPRDILLAPLTVAVGHTKQQRALQDPLPLR